MTKYVDPKIIQRELKKLEMMYLLFYLAKIPESLLHYPLVMGLTGFSFGVATVGFFFQFAN